MSHPYNDKSGIFSKIAESLAENLPKRSDSDESLHGDCNSPLETLTLIKVNTEVLAKQITLIEYKYFKSIRREELMCLKGNATDRRALAPNLDEYIKWSNRLSSWVQDEILREEKPTGRVEVLRKFLSIIRKLEELRNYSSIMALASATQADCIYRLKIWNHLPSSDQKYHDYILDLIKPDSNFEKMREVIRKSEFKCIPFLGIYMKDLTYLGEMRSLKSKSHTNVITRASSSINCSTKKLSRTDLHDLKKTTPSPNCNEKRLDNILDEISSFKADYNFPIFKTVQNHLQNLPLNNDEKERQKKSDIFMTRMSNSNDNIFDTRSTVSGTSMKSFILTPSNRKHQRSESYNPPLENYNIKIEPISTLLNSKNRSDFSHKQNYSIKPPSPVKAILDSSSNDSTTTHSTYPKRFNEQIGNIEKTSFQLKTRLDPTSDDEYSTEERNY